MSGLLTQDRKKSCTALVQGFTTAASAAGQSTAETSWPESKSSSSQESLQEAVARAGLAEAQLPDEGRLLVTATARSVGEVIYWEDPYAAVLRRHQKWKVGSMKPSEPIYGHF